MSDGLDSLSLLPDINWYGGLEDDWVQRGRSRIQSRHISEAWSNQL